jgi:hypothetical protein
MSSAIAAARRRQRGDEPEEDSEESDIEDNPGAFSLGKRAVEEAAEEVEVSGPEQTFASKRPRPDEAALKSSWLPLPNVGERHLP